ncbi:MAG: NYN domain-containing protein [bacterium]
MIRSPDYFVNTSEEKTLRAITYIDGFNLYFGLRSQGWKRYYWLNIQLLAKNLLSAGFTLVATKYFTTYVKGPPDKKKRQSTFIEALRTLSDFEFFFGHYLTNPYRCHQCGYKEMIPKEKRTDVNIAVEILTDAYSDRFDVALLISGDSDLEPALSKVRNEFPEKQVFVAFPPNRVSKNLETVAHEVCQIRGTILDRSMFPDRLVNQSGYELTRPVQWELNQKPNQNNSRNSWRKLVVCMLRGGTKPRKWL